MKRTKQCKKCVLKDSIPGVSINEQGICSECDRTELTRNESENQKKIKLQERMEGYFTRAKKQNNLYDVAVSYSGGKDSSYLIHVLQKKYDLKVLAISIVHPFLNALAKRNIEKVRKTLNVELLEFHISENVFKEYLQHGLSRFEDYQLYEGAGCRLCGILHIWPVYVIAMRMRIPLVVDGFDPMQALRQEIVEGEYIKLALENNMKFFGVMPEILNNAFKGSLSGSIYDTNIKNYKNDVFPTRISPLGIIDTDYDARVVELDKNNILNKEETYSVKTNCTAHHLFAYLSFRKYDCHPYDRLVAIGIRNNLKTILETLKIDGKQDVNRDDIVSFLDEYKKALFLIAENRDICNQNGHKALAQRFPELTNFLGEKGLSVMIEDMFKIHEHAEYFGIDLLDNAWMKKSNNNTEVQTRCQSGGVGPYVPRRTPSPKC